jgi:glycosyltransferase involved in cell wall biosynthesis
MKALLLTDSNVLAGTERHMLDLAVGLRRRGLIVAIGCPGGAEQTPLARMAGECGIEHRAVRKRGAIDPGVVRQLTRWLRSGEIDLIHAHNGRTALHATMAKRLARRGRVVFTQHFITPHRAARRGVKRFASQRLHGWMTRWIDHTIAISQAVRQAAVARGDAPAHRITIVHNGISDPAGDQRSAGAVRADFDVPAAAPLVVCAARLQPEKDVRTLIDAMGRVVTALPESRCLIAGQGVEHAMLQERIAELGLGESVRLTGFRQDVRDLIAACDLFALPAKAEPFGLVLLEAMAFGRPVVATHAGGPLDIVLPGQTGALFEPMNAIAMAEAMGAILRDPARRDAMGQAGRQRFEACFTADRMAEATAAIYAQVLAGDLSDAATAGRNTASTQ